MLNPEHVVDVVTYQERSHMAARSFASHGAAFLPAFGAFVLGFFLLGNLGFVVFHCASGSGGAG